MGDLLLTAKDIRKDFNRRTIFEQISFELFNHGSLSITGRNGSGKTTLVKILSGLLTPTKGSVTMTIDKSEVRAEDRRKYLGFVSPYLQLYDEFTGYENLLLASKIRGRREDAGEIEGLLKRVDLFSCRNDRVATYSSGMKQRLKYTFALLHKPLLLILDEPMTNLDEAGIELVHTLIAEQKQTGAVIVATNDAHEAAICDQNLDLNFRRPVEVGAFS